MTDQPPQAEADLTAILRCIQGQTPWYTTPGLTSFVDTQLHRTCLELERRGLIVRQLERPDAVLWMPAPPA